MSHYWIVANQAPIWPNETKPVPLGFQSDMSNGRFYDAELTTDGTRAVNTIYSENQVRIVLLCIAVEFSSDF